MWRIFTSQSPYKKRARLLAILWTLLIFIACFIPGNEIPDLQVPMADKWVHFVLFGVMAFLWLCAFPGRRLARLITAFLLTASFGWLVEWVQGRLSFLGRSQDPQDTLADAIGAALGVLLYALLAARAAGLRRKRKHRVSTS